ncbi:hypothetical protein [Nostoc sp.]
MQIQASEQENQQTFIDLGKTLFPNNIIETNTEIKITIPIEHISNFNQLLKNTACLSLAENIFFKKEFYSIAN